MPTGLEDVFIALTRQFTTRREDAARLFHLSLNGGVILMTVIGTAGILSRSTGSGFCQNLNIWGLDANGGIVISFRYGTDSPWPAAPDAARWAAG